MRTANNLEEGVGLVLNVDDGPLDGFQDGDVLLKIGTQMLEKVESLKRFGLTTILKLRCGRDGVFCIRDVSNNHQYDIWGAPK